MLPEELCGIRSPSRSPPGPVNSGSGPGTDFNSSPRASLPQNIHKLKQRAYPRWSLSNTSLETSSNPTGQQLPHHNLARPSKVLVTWSVESFQDLSPCPQGSPVPRTLGWGKMVDFVGKNRDNPNTHTCTHTRAHTRTHMHMHADTCTHTCMRTYNPTPCSDAQWCAGISSVQFSQSVVSDSATPWTAARQASLSITNSWSLLKLMSIESVMPSNHLVLCRPLLLSPSIFPSIRIFSNESALRMRWPKYWSCSFNISPSNEHPGLISLRMDWGDLLAVQGTLKSLLQHHSSKASIL